MLSQQGPQLLLEPRQRAVSVFQPVVRHRHRLALLADHLAIPQCGGAVSYLERQDRRPRHHDVARERAVGHADLSRLRAHHLHQPGRHARRPLRHVLVVRRRGRATQDSAHPQQVLRRHGTFPGARHRHVHAVADRRPTQQPNDAADREVAEYPLQGSRGAGADRARRDPGRPRAATAQAGHAAARKGCRAARPSPARRRGPRRFASSSASRPIRR